MSSKRGKLTSSHWGAGIVETKDGRITAVGPHPRDPQPSALNDNIVGNLYGTSRIRKPAVRASWLENGPGPALGKRGQEPFVEVSWDKVEELIALELKRIRADFGNHEIFAGSYGWASAGRTHHAQSLLKRFLNTQGGFVRSEGNYSYNAALELMPHLVGPFRDHVRDATRWPVIAKHGELVVAFGGLAERNTQICDGGSTLHKFGQNLEACAVAGVKFINISPLRRDMSDAVQAEWVAPRPGSDTALMMGLAHTLLVEDLYDQAFLDRYTKGFDAVRAALLGQTDGVVKDAAWAANQSGIAADRIQSLAREMATSRTMISVAAGLQRADFGEQPLWMALTLAAMLGQIGLPGGGYTIGYAVNGNVGNTGRLVRAGAMPQLSNPVKAFIPVAAITDMLLNPGGAFSYQGKTYSFPHARMVWWAGGNPFHHHQDLNRLVQGFQQPDTIIVNEISWTATARHADIVLPVAAPQERTDFGAGKTDCALVPMPVQAPPPFEARLEYDIYASLAGRLGDEEAFTKGRTAEEWAEALWNETCERAELQGVSLPDWQSFLAGDFVELPDPAPEQVFLADFRADPVANALPTPSGKIELFSKTIADFGLADCPGQATWFPPRESDDKQRPLHLISGQPKTRLHSQQDDGSYSRSGKIKEREPILVNPVDALARGIKDGDVVEVFNGRGRCLAGVEVTEDISAGCVFLWTGAWYDPASELEGLDRHGNPNVLTHDLKTSSLSQSPSAHSARVDIRPWVGPLPPVRAFEQPRMK